MGRSRAARCLRIVKNSIASDKEFTLICNSLNVSQEFTHSSRIPLLLHGQFINSCLSSSICFFATKFIVNLQFLGNLLPDFLGSVYSSFPIHHTSLSLVSALIRML